MILHAWRAPVEAEDGGAFAGSGPTAVTFDEAGSSLSGEPGIEHHDVLDYFGW